MGKEVENLARETIASGADPAETAIANRIDLDELLLEIEKLGHGPDTDEARRLAAKVEAKRRDREELEEELRRLSRSFGKEKNGG